MRWMMQRSTFKDEHVEAFRTRPLAGNYGRRRSCVGPGLRERWVRAALEVALEASRRLVGQHRNMGFVALRAAEQYPSQPLAILVRRRRPPDQRRAALATHGGAHRTVRVLGCVLSRRLEKPPHQLRQLAGDAVARRAIIELLAHRVSLSP
jgi:hypothetical protein